MTTRSTNTPTMWTVTDGRTCIGFIMRRKDVYEAFTATEQSL
jgi:hypothetical protein